MSFFAVYDRETRAVKRAGKVPAAVLRAQARRAGEVCIEIDASYAPNDLYIDDDLVVRRRSDGAAVAVGE